MFRSVAVLHMFTALIFREVASLKIELKVNDYAMAESADYDEDGTAKDNLIESCDGHDAGWDISGAYESSNSELTAYVGINDALHSFQGSSDFLLEKYVEKVHSNFPGLQS